MARRSVRVILKFDKIYNILYIFVMPKIGQKLHAIRLEKNITQAKLVELTGIPQSGISNIERGKNDITVSTLIRVCAALQTPVAEIFAQNSVHGQNKKMTLTRNRLQRIADAVVSGKVLKSSDEDEVVRRLRMIVPLYKTRKSYKNIQKSWSMLRRQFTKGEIRILVERVRGAYAKKSG